MDEKTNEAAREGAIEHELRKLGVFTKREVKRTSILNLASPKNSSKEGVLTSNETQTAKRWGFGGRSSSGGLGCAGRAADAGARWAPKGALLDLGDYQPFLQLATK